MLNDTPTPSSNGSAMMLAKFSGSGSNTITRTVIAPDSSRGAMTSAASRKRRNAINRIAAIASTADAAAAECTDDGGAGRLDRYRGAARIRRHAGHLIDEFA